MRRERVYWRHKKIFTPQIGFKNSKYPPSLPSPTKRQPAGADPRLPGALPALSRRPRCYPGRLGPPGVLNAVTSGLTACALLSSVVLKLRPENNNDTWKDGDLVPVS